MKDVIKSLIIKVNKWTKKVQNLNEWKRVVDRYVYIKLFKI